MNLVIAFLEAVALKVATNTVQKVTKYGVISGPDFPIFGLNSGK